MGIIALLNYTVQEGDLTENIEFSDAVVAPSHNVSHTETITFADSYTSPDPELGELTENITLADAYTAPDIVVGNLTEEIELLANESIIQAVIADLSENIELLETTEGITPELGELTENIELLETSSAVDPVLGELTENIELIAAEELITPAVRYLYENIEFLDPEFALIYRALGQLTENIELLDSSPVQSQLSDAVSTGLYPPRFYLSLPIDTEIEYDEWYWISEESIFIPISSFQARWAFKGYTGVTLDLKVFNVSLSVSIPGIESAAAIAAAPNNGYIRLWMDVLEDGILSKKQILPQLRVGAISESLESYEESGLQIELNDNSSISLSANFTIAANTGLEPSFWNPRVVRITDGFISKSVNGGNYQYKFPLINPWIKAGDIMHVDGNIFTIDTITYTVSLDSGGLIMDVQGA